MAGFFLRVFAALVLGLGFSQSGEFTQQYLQRLGGAADELRQMVARFDESASAESLSREEALRRLAANADRMAVRQGEGAARAIARFDAVSRRYGDLLATAPVFRPFTVAADPDGAVLLRAAEDFRPALPLTADGLLFAALGFVLGWMLGSTGAGLGRRIAARRRRRTVG